MSELLVSLVVFLSVFTQSLTGFGSALVAMAFLPSMLGIQVATPLVALMGLTIEISLLLRYHSAFRIQAAWRLVAASVVGIPVGLLVLRKVDEKVVLAVLGGVLVAYSLYALLNLRLPQMKHPAWAYGSGFLAGMLGGAYNTSGPPVVIYGDSQRWEPAEFKSNLQGFFFATSLFVIAGHVISRNLTSEVWHSYLWALPAILLGILAGIRLDSKLDPALFRRLVLVLLVIMGARMLLFS